MSPAFVQSVPSQRAQHDYPLALSARVACNPNAIVATALPTMPRKHADVDYNVAMLHEIGRAAAKREEDAAREQGELVRVTCRYFPAP